MVASLLLKANTISSAVAVPAGEYVRAESERKYEITHVFECE